MSANEQLGTIRLLTLEKADVLRASKDEKELSKVTSEPPKIFADISQDIQKEKSKLRTLDPRAATNPSRLSDALAALNLALAMALFKSSSLSPLADAFSA